MTGNHQIVRTDDLPLPFEIGPYICEMRSRRMVERQQVKPCGEGLNLRPVFGGLN